MMDKISQTKFDAISAKNLHRLYKWKYETFNKIILVITVIVPLMFIIALYVSKGSKSEGVINIISFILSILLICVSILASIMKVIDKISIHKMGIKSNLYIVNECDNLAGHSEKDLEWFFRYVSEISTQDQDTFANIPESLRKKIYLNALKELNPSDHSIKCPNCNSSPWNYKKGDCQLCGNTKTK